MSLKSLLSNPWFKHLLKFGFSIAIVVYLLTEVDVTALLGAFASATVQGVMASVAFVILGVIVFQALEIHWSMRPGSRIRVVELCKINLSLMFYVLFLPAGLTFLIRWDKYRRAGYGGYDSAVLVGFHKVLQLGVATAVSALALLLAKDTLGPHTDGIMLAIVISMAGLAILGLLLTTKVGSATSQWCVKVLSSGASSDWTRTRFRLLGFLQRAIAKLSAALDAFGQLGWRAMSSVLTFAVLQHFFILLSSWAIVEMVVPDVSFVAVAFVRSVTVILLMAPVSVGGLGVRELVFFTLFPLFGVSGEEALTSSLILFGVQLIVSAIGALIELEDWFRPKARA